MEKKTAHPRAKPGLIAHIGQIIGDMPLIQSLGDKEFRSRWGLQIFYIGLWLVAFVCAGAPFSRPVVSLLMANHHFRPQSWTAWIVLQPVPKMYSFANTCWIGKAPLLEQKPEFQSENRFLRERFWVNHYPARKARFDGGREALGLGIDHYVYVRSVYFGYSETTGFRVKTEPGRCIFELRGRLP